MPSAEETASASATSDLITLETLPGSSFAVRLRALTPALDDVDPAVVVHLKATTADGSIFMAASDVHISAPLDAAIHAALTPPALPPSCPHKTH